MNKIKITKEGFKCERCGHEWIPNNIEEPPTVCPDCKSPYWAKKRKNENKNGTEN